MNRAERRRKEKLFGKNIKAISKLNPQQAKIIDIAATEPIMDMKTKSVNFTKRLRKYPIDWIEKAEANGISDYNFRRRVREYNWSYEKAATTPVREIHSA